MLYAINFQSKEIFLSQFVQIFNDIFIILFDNFGQLSPVLDNSLYTKLSETSLP